MSNENQAVAAHLRRLALDLGPLIVFFATYQYLGIYAATGVFMVAIFLCLGLGYWLERKLSPMAIVTAVIVLIFGGLTLYLHNAMFIKLKPTIIYTIFGLILLGGLAFNRLFIKYILEMGFELSEAGWRTLTWRWGFFFLALAVTNEIVWRNFAESTWVSFKTWGVIPLMILFSVAQAPLITKHNIEENKDT
ncbi:MAG TPA: septation protein A [Rhizomicrobium sp.]|jgi:intracellular septation protein|nr:septation protein A [Rhizomicrobium sp.]